MTANLPHPGAHQTAPHHHDGPDTEREAASLIEPKAGTLRCLALAHLAAAGARGLTDHELAAATGKYLYTVAPRRVELLQAGWVVDSGQRRKSPNGRNAVAWRITQAAAQRLGVALDLRRSA